MRDALSILDQAIASSTGTLTSDSVRNLVGAAPAFILERVMQAVAESKSDEILRQVDQLLSEGYSPTHFARQMVRFLRHATVAKIAGKDSSLLQISSEERERVARVAEWFGEEDLTRHLQIMLRTHGELGYKQEQRFHLELGLLKMSHAQKLIPIEQLLSDAANLPAPPAHRSAAPRPAIVASTPSELRRTDPPAGRPNLSPFAADSARKGTPRQEDSTSTVPAPGPRMVAAASPQPEPVILGSVAPAPEPPPDPAVRMETTVEESNDSPTARSPADWEDAGLSAASSDSAAGLEKLQAAVLEALTNANQPILVSMLSAGDWSVAGSELIIKVAESETVVDMSLGPEGKRLAIASASGVLGRPVKLKVIPGAAVSPPEKKKIAAQFLPGPGGRGRAEQDPIVRRMQEKFGAEIRTVIDYREKR
jgi:DNA polymerase III subunit gamma/tau